MVQSHLLLGPTPIHGFPFIANRNGDSSISASSFNGNPSIFVPAFGNRSISASPFNGIWRYPHNHHSRQHCNRWVPPISSSFKPAAGINGEQNHYTVLGVARNASSADIKRAYRLLALKYHPDVCKDSQASEVFKSIRHAYEVLSNEVTRIRYDRTLTASELEREMRENPRVVKSTFLTLYLLQIFSPLFTLHLFGSRFSLAFSCLIALFDKKINGVYKIGYGIAWVLGGRHGVLLTLCLRVAHSVCGSSISAVVLHLLNLLVLAMWVVPNLARYAPLPQGALLALLYMSAKLQVDLVFSHKVGLD